MSPSSTVTVSTTSRNWQATVFPILDVLLNFFNWGFHILVCWYLVPADYGQLNSLLALLSLLMVSGVALQLLTAKHVAAHGLDDIPHLRQLSLGVALGVSLLGLAALPFLTWLTRGSVTCILLVLAIFSLNAVLSVQRGIQQGNTTFLSLNGSFYVEVLAKLAATAALLSFWRTPEAALTAIGLGMAASLAVTSSHVGPSHRGKPASASGLFSWVKKLAPVISTSFFLYFFSSVDMLMVNRLLPGQAGNYAVAAKYGQILFFAALSVATVFIPQLSRARQSPLEFRRQTGKLLGILAIAAVLGILLGITLLPSTVAPVFGHIYQPAQYLVPSAMLAYALLSLCFGLVNVLVILEQRGYLTVLLLTSAALVTLLGFFHSTPQLMLHILSATYGILFLLLLVLTRQGLKAYSHVTHS